MGRGEFIGAEKHGAGISRHGRAQTEQGLTGLLWWPGQHVTCRAKQLDLLRRLVAAGCVALVLALTVLAVCPALHAWLHGEKQLDDDDDCAVVLFVQGVTPAVAAIMAFWVALRALAEDLPGPRVLFLEACRFLNPPGRGPPSA